MSDMKKIRISYGDRLLISFLFGVAIGTILLNVTSTEVKSGLSAFPFSAGGTNRETISGEIPLFVHLLCRRCFAVFIGWLMGMTPYGAACFYGLSGYAGVTMGITLSVFTWQKGVFGLFYFLITIFPHSLFYGAVWLGLAALAGKTRGKPRWILIAGLFGLCMLGTAAECWIFPVVWEWGNRVWG